MVDLLKTEHAFRARIMLACIVCAIFLPFAGKAVHVDDPLFIWVARQIASHPLDFYGFEVNWYGALAPVHAITKNPPLFSYYLASAATLFGWSEVGLHLAALVSAVAAALGTYQLADRLGIPPLEAALSAVFTPVFLVSGTALMCDMSLVACWVWGGSFWVSGVERSRPLHCAVAALLVAAAGLTKYFGMSLVPLLAAYTLWPGGSGRRHLPWLLLPVAVFVAYEIWSRARYGTGLVSDAFGYSGTQRELFTVDGLLTGLSFTGGCLLSLIPCALLFRWRGWLAVCGVLLLFLLVLPLAGEVAGFNLRRSWPQLLQMALFCTSATCLLFLATRDFLRQRDGVSLLLLLWILGTFVFASLLNWTVSGRNILPMAPAAGLVIARQIRAAGIGRPALLLALVPAAALSLLVALADYRWAGESRRMAGQTAALKGGMPGTLWFQSHWGFQYYLERAGGKAIDFEKSRPMTGDLVVDPSTGTNIRTLERVQLSPLQILITSPLGFLAVNDFSIGAGYYTSQTGPLPYSFGPVQRDMYRLQMVTAE